MGSLAKLSTVRLPARAIGRGSAAGEDFWYVPDGWLQSLTAAGVGLTPELAMTLSYVYSAVLTISDDFGTMTCQMFKDLGDQGHRKVKITDPGIGALAYRLRWQPNSWQTSKAFWSTLVWQYLLRPNAYAEIIYRKGSDSFVDQLIPRHPDRIEQQRLPNGSFRFKVTEADGSTRYITEAEMFVVRNSSTDGINALSRVEYGGKTLASGLALQDFTRNYFKKGATASLLATYKGAEMDDEAEEGLHKSITRYVAGVDNAGGLLVVPEDIDVKSLGVDPEKAQLLGLKDLNGRDVARMFKMPPHKLGIATTHGYGSQVQAAQEYAQGCQMPIAVEFEQAIFIHLIMATIYYAKFNMDYLARADLKSRMEAYEIGIRSRVLRPSEARGFEDMSPDKELDKLSELDHRPGGGASGGSGGGTRSNSNGNDTNTNDGASARELRQSVGVRATLMAHDNALRVLRREREAVKKLAKKHADDVEGWREGLRDFYADHATFVGETMRLPMALARAYAAQHGSVLEAQGIVVMDDEHWERLEAEDLTTLALDRSA